MIWSHNGKEMSVSCDNVVTRHEQHYFVGFLAQSFYKRLRNGQDIPRRCCSSVAFSYFTFDKSTSADPFFALRCAGQTLPGWHGRFHSGTLSALKWSQSKQLFQGRHGRFLAGKDAIVVATSPACRRCFLFLKIQLRTKPWLPCLPWLPCNYMLCLEWWNTTKVFKHLTKCLLYEGIANLRKKFLLFWFHHDSVLQI